MNFIFLLLFSISTNLDNIPVGISYSLTHSKKKFSDISIISFFTSFITLLIMIVGTSIGNLFPLKFADTLRSRILILIGGYGLIKEYILNKKNNNCLNQNNPKNLSKAKLILLLSLNNLATGLSASIASINIILSTILIFIFSVLFLYLGILIGNKINCNKLEKYSSYISNGIILLLGIIQLIF